MTKAGDITKRQLELPREVGCDGKAAFETRQLARVVLERCNRRKVRGRDIYRCAACRQYHLGRGGARAERNRRGLFMALAAKAAPNTVEGE